MVMKSFYNFAMLRAIVGVTLMRLIFGQPCPNECNSHGLCASPSRQCQCFTGYTGADCSLLTCPFGSAWADQATGTDLAHNLAECSNMGLCDRLTGVCACQIGFEGNACQRKSCPSYCNFRGQCLSMRNLARTKDRGLGTVFNYTSIWDADMIQGCLCDEGYSGPDCSLEICPLGDDPLTGAVDQVSTDANPTQYNEKQTVTCQATSGKFTLTYKGKTTAPISATAQIGELVAALENLETIGANNIKITMYSLEACLVAGASWTVEFVQQFGPLPDLVPASLSLANTGTAPVSLSVGTSVIGTKENVVCSNRGTCDVVTGICACSTNFDTSDGYNNPGTRGDCGYATVTIQFCPGVISCSAHGECSGSPTYSCQCFSGWTGADCSERFE